MVNTKPVKLGKNIRQSFAHIDEVAEMPNLIEVQKNSYQWFLDEGLRAVFKDISSITDYQGNLQLDFIDFTLDDKPKYPLLECKERDVNYAAPLRVRARLINKVTGEIKESDIYMGDFPLMTEAGTFIINGAERVIVSQLVRSPGVYNSSSKDKTGKEMLVPQYAWAGDFTDGKAFVTEQNGKTWLIDKSGKKVQFITEGLPVIQARENSSAVIQVPLADWGYGDDMTGCPYYNQKGEKLNLTEIALLDAVDGIAVAYDWVTHKRFYIDESGKQCIADTFDGVDAFLDGYAVVQKAVTGADGKEDVEWGIIKR